MKNIVDKFKEIGEKVIDTGKKYIKPVASLAAGVAMYAQANSQDFDYERNIAVFNSYMQPNIVQGSSKGQMEYYGSGDVNNDGDITMADAQAISSGVKNDMADVDGNGVVNSTDSQMIQEYSNGERSYLPGHWNELSKLKGANEEGVSRRRAEKIDWLKKMIAIDKTDENTYVGNDFYDCEHFAKQTFVNFTGVDNFENYENYDKFVSRGAKNGRFNIPIYYASTYSDPDALPSGAGIEASGHAINYVVVGNVDSNVIDDPLKFDQRFAFEPQNDQEVIVGDWNMNDNKSVIVKGIAYAPYPDGTRWEHDNFQLIQYELNDGVPSIRDRGVSSYLITENPLRMNPRVVRENDADEITVNYSANIDIDGAIGNVSAEADTEHYQDRVGLLERKISEPTWQSSDYPNIEYDIVVTDQAQVDVGMNPAKSPESKVILHIRDIESPVYDGWTSNTAKADFGTDPLDLAREHTGTITDNSGLDVDTVYTTTSFPSRTEGLYNYFDVQGTATDKFGEATDMGTFEAGIRMFPTGMNEAEEQRGFDIEPQYSARGVNLKTFASERGDVSMEIFNMSGQLVKQEYFGANQGMEKDVWMNNFTPGTYVVRGTLKTKSGEFYIDTEEIFIGCSGF